MHFSVTQHVDLVTTTSLLRFKYLALTPTDQERLGKATTISAIATLYQAHFGLDLPPSTHFSQLAARVPALLDRLVSDPGFVSAFYYRDLNSNIVEEWQPTLASLWAVALTNPLPGQDGCLERLNDCLYALLSHTLMASMFREMASTVQSATSEPVDKESHIRQLVVADRDSIGKILAWRIDSRQCIRSVGGNINVATITSIIKEGVTTAASKPHVRVVASGLAKGDPYFAVIREHAQVRVQVQVQSVCSEGARGYQRQKQTPSHAKPHHFPSPPSAGSSPAYLPVPLASHVSLQPNATASLPPRPPRPHHDRSRSPISGLRDGSLLSHSPPGSSWSRSRSRSRSPHTRPPPSSASSGRQQVPRDPSFTFGGKASV